MNNVASHFPSPQPLWALTLGDGLHVRKRDQLLALTQGGHQPHSSSVKPAVALQLMSPASQVGFGQDREATSMLRHCYCLALWIQDLAVLSDARTVWSQQSASYVNYVLEIAQGSWYIYVPLASFVRVCQVTNERESCLQRLSKPALADDILLAIFARKLKQYVDMVKDTSLFQCQCSHVLWANSHLPHSCMKTCTLHKCLCVVDEILIITLSITCSYLDQNNY